MLFMLWIRYRKMTEKKINYQFKILYAFAMIMIVCNHASGGGLPLLFNWFPIEVSSVEIFVFGAGYFYSEKNEDKVVSYTKNKIIKLLIPLYLWNMFYGIFTTIISNFGFNLGMKMTLNTLFIQPIINGHQFDFNMASWFVAPLFLAEIVYVLLRKMIKNINNTFIAETVFVVVLFGIGIMGLYVASLKIESAIVLLLERTTFFLPFYGLGYYYRKYLEDRDTSSNTVYLGTLFVITAIILLVYGHIPGAAPSSMQFYEDGLIIPFATAVVGIAFYLRLARVLEPIIGHSKLVNDIADNSFSIMVNQFLGFAVLNAIYCILWAKAGIFKDFSLEMFKNYIFYLYLPKEVDNFKILYVVFGLVIPIYMQKTVNAIKERFLQNA